MKVLGGSSLEPPLEYDEILYSFRLVLKGKTGEKIPEPSKLEFYENFQQTILLYQMQRTTPLGR